MFSFDGNTYTLAVMLAANCDDDAFCDLARTAEVGARFEGCERVA